MNDPDWREKLRFLQLRPVTSWVSAGILLVSVLLVVAQAGVENFCQIRPSNCRGSGLAPSYEPALYLGAIGIALRMFEIVIPAIYGMVQRFALLAEARNANAREVELAKINNSVRPAK